MGDHSAMHLDQFLEQRIAEDEARAHAAMEQLPTEDSRLVDTPDGRVGATGWRTLAEVALKREMLFTHHDVPTEDEGTFVLKCATCQEPYPCQSLRITASVFSDHPRFNPAWKPSEPDTRAD